MTRSKLDRTNLAALDDLMRAEKELPVVALWDIDVDEFISRKDQEEIFVDCVVSMLTSRNKAKSCEDITIIIMNVYWIHSQYKSSYVLDLSSKLLASQPNLSLDGLHGKIGRFLSLLPAVNDSQWLEFWADVVEN